MTVIEQWLMNKICHKEIGEYLKNSYKIQTVAIYGAGKLGEFLYDLSFSGTGLNFKRIASPDDFLIACCTQGICSAF